MAFNIKNEETHRLAREVADLTGESMSQAVATALRERRARLAKVGLSERLMAIGRDAASRIPPELRHEDLNEYGNQLLYDEKGLPK